MIEEHTFREDLYYRLNTATVTLPALRERREDIPLLVSRFLSLHSEAYSLPNPGLEESAMKTLMEHSWPGNVRQLENLVKRLLVGSRGGAISAEAVSTILHQANIPVTTPSVEATEISLAQHVANRLQAAYEGELENLTDILVTDMEKELYAQAFRLLQGNQTQLAALLGQSRTTVRDKLARYKEVLPGPDDR